MNSSEDNQTVSVLTSKLTPAADIWVGLITLIIAVLAVLGNGLVLLISYCSWSTIVGWEMLCINLAVADFFSCILFYPLSIASSFQHTWLGGSTSCTYYGFGRYVFSLCSVLTITAISGLRYLKICQCSVYSEWIRRANIQRACCFIWLVATVWSSFPLLGWGEYVLEPYGLSCTVAWRSFHASAKDAFYVVCSFSLFTLIPFLLIVVSQCQIIFALSRLSSQMSHESVRNRLKRTEKQLCWMFSGISLGFVVTWLPYTIVYLLFLLKGHQYMAPGSFVFPAILAKSSHVYNPLIYFCFNKDFRKKFCHLFDNFRVEQEETGVDIGLREREQNPPPIDIQVHDRSRPQKKKSVSQDKSKGSNRSEDRAEEGSGSHPSIQAVRTCWDCTLEKNAEVVLEKEPTQVSTLV